MMSLFSLMIGILAMVLWQKAHLANRNASLDSTITELQAKVAEAGKGSPFFSDEQWRKALANKDAEILKLQIDLQDQTLARAELKSKMGQTENERKKLEQKVSDLEKLIAEAGKNLDDAIRQRGDIKLQPIRQLQRQVALGIADVAELKVGPISDDSVQLLDSSGRTLVTIMNDGYLQTLRFGADTLFESNSFVVPPDAEKLLSIVSMVLAKFKTAFKEVQIQGHADTNEPSGTNMELASNRAMMVYSIFADHLRPWNNLISVTSYGQYKPVSRIPGSPFDLPDLKRSNSTAEIRSQNRRVEVFLIYSTP